MGSDNFGGSRKGWVAYKQGCTWGEEVWEGRLEDVLLGTGGSW